MNFDPRFQPPFGPQRPPWLPPAGGSQPTPAQEPNEEDEEPMPSFEVVKHPSAPPQLPYAIRDNHTGGYVTGSSPLFPKVFATPAEAHQALQEHIAANGQDPSQVDTDPYLKLASNSHPAKATPAAKTAKAGSKTGSVQTQSKPVTFDDVYNAAKALGDPHPNVVAAQWAEESGWGKKQSGRYNYFGIMGSGPLVATHEYSQKLHKLVPTYAHFQNFASLQDGIAYHTRLINSKKYSGYATSKTDEEAIDALVRGGYATNPAYKSELMSIIRKHGVGIR